MKTIRLAIACGLTALAVMAVGVLGVAHARAQDSASVETIHQTEESGSLTKEAAEEHVAVYIAIAVSIAGSCLAAGYAVGKVGSAALGAVAEHPELMGRALIFVGLAEGIAIYGLIVAVMLIRKI